MFVWCMYVYMCMYTCTCDMGILEYMHMCVPAPPTSSKRKPRAPTPAPQKNSFRLNGSDSRVVVTLEFHPHGKIGPLSVYDNPCPSRRRRVPDLKETWDKERWIHGEAGYDWYARE